MDNKEYGVKLTLDTKNFTKGIKEAKEAIDSFKEKTTDEQEALKDLQSVLDGNVKSLLKNKRGMTMGIRDALALPVDKRKEYFKSSPNAMGQYIDAMRGSNPTYPDLFLRKENIFGDEDDYKLQEEVNQKWQERAENIKNIKKDLEKNLAIQEQERKAVQEIAEEQKQAHEEKMAQIEEEKQATVENGAEQQQEAKKTGNILQNIFKGKSNVIKLALASVLLGLMGIKETSKEIAQKSIENVKRFSLTLLGIRGTLAILQKATNSYLSISTDTSKKLEASWLSLGMIIGPVIEKLIEWFRKLVGYVNVIYKAFTGKNIFQQAMDKATASTKKATGATKELRKELASIDEITNLSFDNGTGTGGFDPEVMSALQEMKDMELNPKIVKGIEWVVGKLKELWDWLQPKLEETWAWLQDHWLELLGWVVGLKVAIGAISFGGMLESIGLVGAGLAGLTLAVLIADILEAIKLMKELNELNDANHKKQEAGENLYDSGKETLERTLEVLKDQNSTQQQQTDQIDATKAVYRNYLEDLKKGVKFSQEEKDYMEETVKQIEKLSGETFMTTIEVQVKANGDGLKWWEKAIIGISDYVTGNGTKARNSKSSKGFAKGNVAYGPTYAEFGEYSGANTNPEITAPQNIMRQTLYEALADALPLINNGSTQQQGDIVLNVNGREFARATYSDYQTEAQRVGSSNVAIRRA